MSLLDPSDALRPFWRWARLPRSRIPMAPRDLLATGAALLAPRAAGPSDRRVGAFEEALAAYVGRRHAIVVGSGKAALALAVRTLDLPPGSGVVVPGLLVPEVVAVLLAEQLVPVIVDVDPETFGLNVEQVEAALTPTTRAILPVHLFGSPCAVDALEALAERKGLALLEDAAQAIGATLGGRPVGSFGRVSTLSLGLFKNVNTLSGGVVVTDDDAIARSVRAACSAWPPPDRRELLSIWLQWATFGLVTRPDLFSLVVHPLLTLPERLSPGWSGRVAHRPDPTYSAGTLDMTAHERSFWPFQARLGARALAAVESRTATRRRNAALLDEVLSRRLPTLPRQRAPEGGRSIRLNYVVLLPDRDRLLPELRQRTGFDLATGYVRDIGAIDAFTRYATPRPVAARVEREHVYIPVQHDVPPDLFRERAEHLADELARLR